MIQILAMLSMLIDHLGVIYNISWLRLIGRISMPLYAYLIYKSYRKHPNNKEYRKRLLYIALISQLPFMGVTYETGFRINVCFTWYMCIIFLDSIHNNDRDNKKCVLRAVLSAFALIMLPFDCGVLTLFWLFIWEQIENKNIAACIAFGGLCALVSFTFFGYIQLLSFVAVPVVLLIHYIGCNDYIETRSFRKVYRYFYPLHLGVLACLH